jgi:hypothetical protein
VHDLLAARQREPITSRPRPWKLEIRTLSRNARGAAAR